MKKALDIIKGLTAEPEVGAIYKGTVKRITDFGAFVEILPNTDGLAPHLRDRARRASSASKTCSRKATRSR